MNPQALGATRNQVVATLLWLSIWDVTPSVLCRWDVTHAQIAQICGISQPSVDRWFSLGKNRRTAEAILYNYELFVASSHKLRHLSCKRTSNF
jgi:hypothetical protein